MMIKLAGIERHSAVNGPGVRYVVFTQGCPHHCPQCQNPETWNPEGGKEYPLETLLNDILATNYIDGVTLSGGDPFVQSEALTVLCQELKKKGLNIWSYTGYTYDELIRGDAGPYALELLKNLDVLVDGPFVISLLSKECLFRGSTNQRLIDVPRSLREGKAVDVDTKSFNFGL